MFYTVKLTNSLFRPSVFFLLDTWAKSIQNTRFLTFSYLKLCRSTTTEWILHSNVEGLYLSGKDSGSNPSRMTQVYLSLYIYIHTHTRARARAHTHTHVYIERETSVIPEGFEPESFPLKYNPTTFE